MDEPKLTLREDEVKSYLNSRLNKIEGQIKGIKKMLENDAYCMDIIIQADAASAAINSFSKELLSNHIRTCVVNDIKNDDLNSIDELTKVMVKLRNK